MPRINIWVRLKNHVWDRKNKKWLHEKYKGDNHFRYYKQFKTINAARRHVNYLLIAFGDEIELNYSQKRKNGKRRGYCRTWPPSEVYKLLYGYEKT